jgi:hypothetical protein
VRVIPFETFPTVVFSLIVRLLLANVWLGARK